ncbi:MAG: calcium-binding protein, partial [Verrucomicrobia bacterium]|nr:calcium-binding protein [Verrucomicrobiota bacterium]
TDLVYSSADTYTLTDNVENLIGLAGSKTLIGNSLDNSITANNSGETILGQGGADTLLGGTGNDRFLFDDADTLNAAASIDGTSGSDTIGITSTAGTTLDNTFFTNVTRIGAIQIDGGDNLVTLGSNASSAGISSLFGGAGNDSFDASNAAYAASSVYFNGGDGDNSLTGNSAADTILSGSGNDTLFGAGGADSIVAGAGNDLIQFDDASTMIAAASIDGTSGNDTIEITSTAGTTLDNTFFTNVSRIGAIQIDGGDNLVTLGSNASSAGISTIIGGAGNDTFDASDASYTSASVYLLGGDGNDTYYVDNSSDMVVEASASGTDLVYSSADTYTLTDNVENLIGLAGSSGDRLQLNGSASEYLFGALPGGFDPSQDIAIYKDVQGTGQYDPSQELIAVIQNTGASFDLTTAGKYV